MNEKSDRFWVEQALLEAKKCSLDVPVGALIVKDNQIIACGYNQREQNQDPIAHAEIVAIQKAAAVLKSWRLEGCVIYSTLEPCPMCAEAIIQTRLPKLVFGAFDATAGAAGSAFNLFSGRKALPVPEIIGGICEEECRTLLTDFFRQQRL